MRLAWIVPPARVAGAWLAASHAIAALQRRGHQVEVLVAEEGLRLHPGSTQAQAALAVRGHVERMVAPWLEAWKRERPQVVHVEVPGNVAVAAAQAVQSLGIPVSASWHALGAYAPAGQERRVRDLALDFHKRCRASVVENAEDEQALRQRGVQLVQRIGRGVDAARFHPGLRDAALRTSWGAGPDDPVLLWLGRVVAAKSPLVFAAACGAARALQPRVRAVVVGDGPELPRLRAALPWAAYAGTITGEDYARTVASADLLAFPSQTEGFGMVVLEALAAGVPVLAHPRAAAGAHVRDGVNGRLVPPGDISAFVEAAATLARDAAQLRAWGAAARAAAEPLTWDAVAQQWEALFAGLV